MKKLKNKGLISIVIVLFIAMVTLIYNTISNEEETQVPKINEQPKVSSEKTQVPKVNEQANIEKNTKLDNAIEASIIGALSNNSTLLNFQSLKKEFKYNSNVDNSNIKEDKLLLGYFDGVTTDENNFSTAAGWVYSENDNIDYILFINDKGEVRGCGLMGAKRVGLSEAIGKKNADNSGFLGYIKISSTEDIYALVKIKGKDEYIKLPQHYKLNVKS